MQNIYQFQCLLIFQDLFLENKQMEAQKVHHLICLSERCATGPLVPRSLIMFPSLRDGCEIIAQALEDACSVSNQAKEWTKKTVNTV